nr:hypothetical protein KPHV_81120 [Kitasatospora purpeofusca]
MTIPITRPAVGRSWPSRDSAGLAGLGAGSASGSEACGADRAEAVRDLRAQVRVDVGEYEERARSLMARW